MPDIMQGPMRQRKEIMSISSDEIFNKSGGSPESVNTAIIVELMLDIRQISAAQLIISDGGSITIPGWVKNIAEGK